MRLSEAIRLGSMLRPKASGWFFRDGASCAQGAALEAMGVTCADGDFEANVSMRPYMKRLWPSLVNVKANCPTCGEEFSIISKRFETSRNMLAHLNNASGHDWTREQIADWVETIERAQEVHDPSCGATEHELSTDALTTSVAHSAPK